MSSALLLIGDWGIQDLWGDPVEVRLNHFLLLEVNISGILWRHGIQRQPGAGTLGDQHVWSGADVSDLVQLSAAAALVSMLVWSTAVLAAVWGCWHQ